ncbi:undecaprenyl-diphosphate phosphatase [Serratia fonticola]|uniref:undecaprenyl-diphosphate phosphatase n=1 Tax=Serratia fonticola TaxID=47917 RepID=UPI003BB7BAB8
MDYFQSVFLALVQGVTEFLPISSSAHLILPAKLFGWDDQGLAFDVAVHVGTLAAVVIYYRTDIIALFYGLVSKARGNESEDGRIALLLILATIPATFFGFIGKDFVAGAARSTLVIAITTTTFGLLLWYADRKSSLLRKLDGLNFKDAVKVGLAQAVALIPGTSRSGITMTMLLLLGFDRQTSAKFSFLLSIPIITLAGLYLSYQLIVSSIQINFIELFIGICVSFVSAYLCIYFFLKVIQKVGMLPFVVYRLCLGLILLFFFV